MIAMQRIGLIALASFVFAAPATADVVYMNNGKIHRGKVTRDGNKVHIKTQLATISVNADEVRKIAKSDPLTQAAMPPTVMPSLTLGASPAGPDRFTRPEPHIFLIMRQLVGSPTGPVAYGLRQQIKEWRVKTHDRLRKIPGRWVSPLDVEQRYEQFAKALNKGQETRRLIQRAGSTTSAGRAKQARLRRQLAVRFREAAILWPDPILRDFLLAVANLEGGNHTNALALFRKCRTAAPRVAAFPQGEAMALSAKGQKLEALATYLEVLHLRPNSRDALDLVLQALRDTPGKLMGTPTFTTARAIVDQYEQPSSSTYTRRGTTWLMPGRSWVGKDLYLPTPTYDRLVFTQAVAVPVSQNALLVDQRAVKGALEVFVSVSPKMVVPGRVQRVSTFGRSKKMPPLAVVSFQDLQFKPLSVDPKAKPAKGQYVTAYGLGLYEQMGGQIRPVMCQVGKVGTEGGFALSPGIVAGEVAAPILTREGGLLGFLAGKTDPMVDDGGPSGVIPLTEITDLVKRAGRSSSSYGGYRRVKRKIVPKPVEGRFFRVLVTSAEAPEGRRRS